MTILLLLVLLLCLPPLLLLLLPLLLLTLQLLLLLRTRTRRRRRMGILVYIVFSQYLRILILFGAKENVITDNVLDLLIILAKYYILSANCETISGNAKAKIHDTKKALLSTMQRMPSRMAAISGTDKHRLATTNIAMLFLVSRLYCRLLLCFVGFFVHFRIYSFVYNYIDVLVCLDICLPVCMSD